MNSKRIYYITIAIIILLGIVLRTLFLLENKPFWYDECMLALNIIYNNDYFHSLYCNQAAPAFFLYISKIIGNILPDTALEVKLRIFPFLCSVFSVFVFYKFSKLFLNKKCTIILATALSGFIYPLIYYAQDFKQYSCDVLLYIVILYSYYTLEKTQNKRIIFLLTVLYSLSIYFSFPSVFAVSAVFITLLIFNRQQFKKMVYILIPVFISIIIFYVNYMASVHSPFLHYYWQDGFISLDWNKNKAIIENLFKYIYNGNVPILFFIISIFFAIKKDIKNKYIALLFIALGISIAVSILHLYPIAERISLYIIPIIILLTVKFLDYVNLNNKYLSALLCLAATFFILYPSLEKDYKNVIQKKYYSEDFLTPLLLAKKMSKPEDIFIISEGNKWFYIYTKKYINIENTVIIEPSFDDEETRLKYLQSYPKGHVYYLIIAHRKGKYKTIYNWAKEQEEFYCNRDEKGNTLIRFKL